MFGLVDGINIYRPMKGADAGYSRFDITPELKAGLRFRPTEVTARDTLDWFRALPPERQNMILGGIDREAELVAAWKARQ
jgi:2'-hydroxyisoflavone reductase